MVENIYVLKAEARANPKLSYDFGFIRDIPNYTENIEKPSNSNIKTITSQVRKMTGTDGISYLFCGGDEITELILKSAENTQESLRRHMEELRSQLKYSRELYEKEKAKVQRFESSSFWEKLKIVLLNKKLTAN